MRRELLVRCLEAWAPVAVQRARRATYVHGYADADDGRSAEAALRVFAELADLTRGREIAMLAVAEDPAGPGARLTAALPVGASAGLAVHTVAGRTDERLPAVLKAAGARGAPLFGCLDTATAPVPPAWTTVAALAGGRPAAALIVLAADLLPGLARADRPPAEGDRLFGGDHWRAAPSTGAQPGPEGERRPGPAGATADLAARYRGALQRAGFPLISLVELVADADPAGDGELMAFATSSGKALEGFKEALWAVDEYAGVRYRDPADPERHPLDISLNPHPGPLRRELLRHIADVREATVTDLKTFALTETVYRAADATRVLGALVAAGAVTRRPAQGRLGGDVVIGAVAD